MEILAGTKRCCKCGEVRALSEFNKRSRTADGYEYRCRACVRIGRQPYRETERLYSRTYYEKNPEKVKAYGAAYSRSPAGKATQKRFYGKHKEERKRRAQAPEQRAKRRVYERAYYQKTAAKRIESTQRWAAKNKARIAATAREYQQRNRDRIREYDRLRHQRTRDRDRELHRIWRSKNPHKVLQYRHNRRGKRFRLDTVFVAELFAQLCDYYGNKCLRCGKPDVKLTPDHIIPLSRGGSNDLFNIQPLCFSCNSAKGNRVIIDYRPDKGTAFAPKQAALFG